MVTINYGFVITETSKSSQRVLQKANSAIADVNFSSQSKLTLERGKVQEFHPKRLFAALSMFSPILIHITEGGSTITLPLKDSNIVLPIQPDSDVLIELENPADNTVLTPATVTFTVIQLESPKMAKKTRFAKFQTKFPTFTVRNKTSISQHIPLANGETVQVQGDATADIDSSELVQLPNMSLFRYINPTLEDVQKAKLFDAAEDEEKEEEDDEDAGKDEKPVTDTGTSSTTTTTAPVVDPTTPSQNSGTNKK